MTIEEFILKATSQPEVIIQREVSIFGPKLSAQLDAQPMLVSELMDHPDQRRELREFRYAHILQGGLSESQLRDWQLAHAAHPLPYDLCQFLHQVDGVHLWADLPTSCAYFGISPLRDWRTAADSEWATLFKGTQPDVLVMSYHDNGDNFLTLDTRTAVYKWFDPQNFCHPEVVAHTLPDLLDFWWQECQCLDPRVQPGTASA